MTKDGLIGEKIYYKELKKIINMSPDNGKPGVVIVSDIDFNQSGDPIMQGDPIMIKDSYYDYCSPDGENTVGYYKCWHNADEFIEIYQVDNLNIMGKLVESWKYTVHTYNKKTAVYVSYLNIKESLSTVTAFRTYNLLKKRQFNKKLH
ncbi:MAG: hypothetical protein ACOCZT_03425, partial [Halanaerobiales bacterium]